MKCLAPAAAAALTLLAARHAAAGESREFAEKGQFILSADRLFPLWSYTKVTTSVDVNGTKNSASVSGSSLVLFYGAEPAGASVDTVPRFAFDYAVIDHLTVGGSLVLAFGLSATNAVTSTTNGAQTKTEVDAPKSTVVGVAPRVGYSIPLGDLFAFWPRAGFSYYSVSTKTTTSTNGATNSTTDTDSIFNLNLEPMFLIAPFKHVFIMAGPVLDVSLTGTRTSKTNNTSQDVDLSLLHFGGEVGLGLNF